MSIAELEQRKGEVYRMLGRIDNSPRKTEDFFKP